MSSTRSIRGVLAGLVAGVLVAAPAAWGARSFISVATGDVSSVYYRAGGGVCSRINAGRSDHQIRCMVKSSSGSVENIDALRRGEHALVFAHSDLAQQAYQGMGAFAGRGAFEGLRTVLALHPETVAVLATPESGIRSVQDLRGKRVSLGEEGSGLRASLQSLMNALGWTPDDFAELADLSATEQVRALCEGEIDAAVFISGHPNSDIEQALACEAEMVPVSGPAIDRMVRNAGFYSESEIPADAYGLAEDVPTYGVSSLLLASTNSSRDLVHEVTNAIFENPSEFLGWHPALAGLEPAEMARGTSAVEAPVHPGAAMYYDDHGLR